MNYINMLSWWQWLILAAVPPLIVMLYFLKLRRQPLEVPSTYLWSRTVEDLHVNSIWQRLRQNLLLLLQLLLLALIIIACWRPGWQGSSLTGTRFVFLLDASASMSATDVRPTRLDAAKDRILSMIDQMKSGDAAMVISFSNVAKVEQPFTDNRRLLRERVGSITPTNRTSDLAEALRAAAGLANPGQSDAEQDLAEAMPATLYIFSDGGFAEVPNFSLGNLQPEYLKMGSEKPANVAISAFSVGRNPDKPGQQEAFARLENFGPQAVELDVSLFRDGGLRDAQKVSLSAAKYEGDAAKGNLLCIPGAGGLRFDLANLEDGQLKLDLSVTDALTVDNVAYASLSVPRRARVLVVTPGNEALQLALSTEEALKIAEIVTRDKAVLEPATFNAQAATGQYDLIIFDRCSPPAMPQCNTLFIAALPPGKEWTSTVVPGPPGIIDTDRAHPLLALVELGNVAIAEGLALKPPRGATVLIDADTGPLLAISPREGYEDAVVGFAIVATDKDGKNVFHTDWYKRLSFPVFFKNVLEYLGGNAGAPTLPSIQPGTPMILRSQSPVPKLTVELPSGQRKDILREAQGSFVFTDTNEQGIYQVTEGSAQNVSQRFAVNLFNSRESNLHPAEQIQLGYEPIEGSTGSQRTRKELWKWLLIAGLGVLIFEWYVYNRRVYY